MTRVIGQIETLKRIKTILSNKGITRFNSIGDINKFIKNYDNEKKELFFKMEQEFDIELDVLQSAGFHHQKSYADLKTKVIIRLNGVIKSLKTKCETLNASPTRNPLKEVGNWYLIQIFMGLTFVLKKSFNHIIWLQTYKANKNLKTTMNKVNWHLTHRQAIISTRYEEKMKDLEFTKKVVDDLNLVIAGAIGENLVEKELKKLSNSNILFNDFSVNFEKPIYYHKDKSRIFSIQIDHLLITNAGLFAIETKNWSKQSIQSLDLRSPIKQIHRSNFALYAMLTNSKALVAKLPKHHWGERKIPVRNIVVMINHRPKEKFKYVEVVTLKELNKYIARFEPLFDDTEVEIIYNYLKTIRK